MTNTNPGKTSYIYIRRSAIAACVSAVLSLIAIILFSIPVSIQILPESFIPALMTIVIIAGGFFCGYLTALSVPAMGLINGLISGAFYFLVMFVVSCIFAPGFAINKTTFTNLLISLLTAGAGGILSINLKASRKSRRRRKNRSY